MLSRFRGLARPFAVLALLALASPALAAECRPLPGSDRRDQTMPCCLQPGTVASLSADCCALEQNTPAPVLVLPTPETARRFDAHAVAAPLAAADITRPETRVGGLAGSSAPPPLERLYLRLSVIRR